MIIKKENKDKQKNVNLCFFYASYFCTATF